MSAAKKERKNTYIHDSLLCTTNSLHQNKLHVWKDELRADIQTLKQFLHSVLCQFKLMKTPVFCRYLWVTKSSPQASGTIRFISIYIFHSIFPRFYFSSWSQARGWLKGGPGRARSPDILANLKISRTSCGIFGDGRNALLFMRPEICPGLACRDIGTKQPLESHWASIASLSNCFKHVASIW